jgi:peptidylprolyl isomerase
LGFESLPRSLNVRAKLLTLALAALLAAGIAACGDDDTSSSGEAAATPTATEAPPAEANIDEIAAGITRNTKQKPDVALPKGDPPAELIKKDIVKGSGPKARAGEQLTMQYVGHSWSNGQQFDASWDRGQPFAFQLGAGMVIPGWDQGLVGMREGGRRLLVIPPDMGYGASGTPDGAIAPNETLVFVVDLEKIG